MLADVGIFFDALVPLAGGRDPSLVERGLLVSCGSLVSVIISGTLSWKMRLEWCLVSRQF